METRIYEREKLYKEVWKEPMTTLATRYGISDVALRKHCLKMNIPLPKSGHWTKVKLGKKISIPPLPEHNGPEQIEVPVQSYNNGDQSGMRISGRLSFLSNEEHQRVLHYSLALKVPERLTKPHDLVEETMRYYSSKKGTTQVKVSRIINLSKISDKLKKRVYRFYSTLFGALEHLGYTIEINAAKSYGYNRRVSDNELIISFGEDSVPIFIKEIQKRIDHIPTENELKNSLWSIPSYDYIRTGKLHFGIDSYHAKRKNWRDMEAKIIEDQIGEIVLWIMEAIHVEKVKREERETEKQRWLEEQRIQEQLAERKEKELKQLELLNQCAQNWEKAERIRKLLDAVELKYANDGTEEEKQILNDWVKWASEKAEFLDPLDKKEDYILGKGLWLFDIIKKKD